MARTGSLCASVLWLLVASVLSDARAAAQRRNCFITRRGDTCMSLVKQGKCRSAALFKPRSLCANGLRPGISICLVDGACVVALPPSPPVRPISIYALHASILLAAKEALGSTGSAFDTWDPTLFCYRWDGVVCDGFGRVIELNLAKIGLSGSIPELISSLIGLEALDLSVNALSGSIPSGIASLTTITRLNLASNFLTGSIPSAIFSMPLLEELYLGSNQLSGSLPSNIGNLPASVRILSLEYNQLTGSLPTTIADLKNSSLQAFSLQYNQLTGALPPLTGIDLSGWDFSSNLFWGACPSQLTANCSASDYSCLQPLAVKFQGNCFTDCSVDSWFTVKQRGQVACAYACGSDQALLGPCQGKGMCMFSGPNQVATCDCIPGFTNPASNPGTCVPAYAGPPRGPRPPPPPVNVSQGVSFALEPGPTRALNRWSRYLSSNYKPQNGLPRWVIGTQSSWLAPGDVFLGYNPDLTGFEGSGTLLKWAGSRDQGACAACWATASTDAVAAAQAIATASAGGNVPELSADQVLRCSANGTSGKCSGDYPTTALEYAARSALLGNASFQAGSSCPSVSSPPAIIMYEAVHFRGWFGLLLTLQKQPALVILEAGEAFQKETCVNEKLVFQDPGCYSGNLDHSVLVVGYDISTLFPYWVIRNSWGDAWCNDGYMKIGIQGGSGVCGMNVLPAYYPVAAPQADDPCYTESSIPDGDSAPALNPCGGGICKPAPAWGKYSYTCKCPTGFVAVNNTVKVTLPGAGQGITQTCAPVDACGLNLANPCSVGTCVNNGKGSYSCLCPIGYFNDTTADGQPTCSMGKAPAQLIVQPGVTCCLISTTYNITRAQLLKQNPELNCSALYPGQVVNTSSPSYSCAVAYTVTRDYPTLEDIAGIVLNPKEPSDFAPGITVEDLQDLNPTATCTAGSPLATGQVICLKAGTWRANLTCNRLYSMQRGDTCVSVTDRFFPNDPIPFYRMNPGLDCGAVANPGPGVDSGIGATGVTVCVGLVPVGAVRSCPSVRTLKDKPARTALHVGTKADTCAFVLSTRCKKFNDRASFSKDAYLTTNPVPDCRKVKGYQFCCPV